MKKIKNIGAQSRFFIWYHESFIVRFLLALLPFFMRTFSRRFLYIIRYPFTWLYYYGGRGFRKSVFSNLRVAMGNGTSERELHRITRLVFGNVTKSFVDQFYAVFLPDGRLAAEILDTPIGIENIERGLARGKGAIFLTGHVGNWEIGGITLNTLGRKVHMVYLPDRFPAFEKMLTKSRAKKHVIGIPMGNAFETSLRLLRLLAAGEVIAMKGDRIIIGEGVTVTFFGKDTIFPKGPSLISYISGAPIIPTFLIANGQNKYQPIVLEPIYPEKTRDKERAIRDNVTKIARVMEEMIRRYPDQWYMFYPFWRVNRT